LKFEAIKKPHIASKSLDGLLSGNRGSRQWGRRQHNCLTWHY